MKKQKKPNIEEIEKARRKRYKIIEDKKLIKK